MPASAVPPTTVDADATPAVRDLRIRIGWLCQTLRFAAVAYALWVFVLVATHWADADDVAHIWGSWLKVTLTPAPSLQRVAGFLVAMVSWGLTVGACWNLWRLFSGFLRGRVFTLDAALTLRRVAIFGLAALIADIASRPLYFMLASGHMPPGSRHVGLFFLPSDLLDLLFLGGLLALAQVFKVAAEIAEDHAAIV